MTSSFERKLVSSQTLQENMCKGIYRHNDGKECLLYIDRTIIWRVNMPIHVHDLFWQRRVTSVHMHRSYVTLYLSFNVLLWHTGASTKLPTYFTWHFHRHFLERNFLYYGSNFTEVCNWHSSTALVILRRQAITWTNYNSFHIRIYVSASLSR